MVAARTVNSPGTVKPGPPEFKGSMVDEASGGFQIKSEATTSINAMQGRNFCRHHGGCEAEGAPAGVRSAIAQDSGVLVDH